MTHPRLNPGTATILVEPAENAMAYSMARWRLLNMGMADGAANMATDEAILRAVAAGLVPPALRFFDW
jgi:lipoate-protein ligase A